MKLAERACVSGIGATAYVRGSTNTAFELRIEASLKAIGDAGLTPKDIDGVIPIGIVSGAVRVRFEKRENAVEPAFELDGNRPT